MCGIVQISGIDLTLKIDVMECYVIVVRFVLDICKVRKKEEKCWKIWFILSKIWSCLVYVVMVRSVL